jgi:hypothetical protein
MHYDFNFNFKDLNFTNPKDEIKAEIKELNIAVSCECDDKAMLALTQMVFEVVKTIK